MNNQEKCLINRIETLRSQLNQNINLPGRRPENGVKTYTLSTELDKLIYQYMKTYEKTQ